MAKGEKKLEYVPLPFPLLGVSRRMPSAAQAPLTCPDARNVRARSATAKTLGGGRRPAIARAMPTAIGGTPRITCLRAYGRIPNTTAPDTTGILVPQVDIVSNWTKAISSGTVARGTEGTLGGSWVVFRKKPDAAWVRGQLGTAGFATLYRQTAVESDNRLELNTIGTATYGDQGEYGLAINYPTDNNLLVKMIASTAVSAEHVNDQCNNVGPFVRGSNDLTQKICAYLEWTGEPHTVRLVIDKLDTTGVTRLASSGKEFRLHGNAGEYLAGLFIRLQATPLKLTATVSWFAAGTTGDVVDTLNLDNTDWATNTRAGVVLRKAGTINTRRGILGFEYNRREPYDFPIATDGDVTPARYEYSTPLNDYIPTGWAATIKTIAQAGAFAVTATAGPANPGTGTGWTTIDPVANTVFSLSSRSTTAAPMVTTTGVTGTDVWALDLAYRDSQDAAADNDELCPCFRVTADYKYMLRVELDRGYTALNKTMQQSEYRRIIVKALANNGAGGRVATTIYTKTLTITTDDPGGADAAVIFSTVTKVRWVLTSADLLQCYVNGMKVFETSLVGLIPASVNGSRVGVDAVGVNDANADIGSTIGVGWQVRNVGPVAFTPVTQGLDLVAASAGAINVGDLAAGTWTTATGAGPSGTLPEISYLTNKAYIVDGEASYELDVPTRKVTTWPGVTNTDLDGCSLTAQFLGRVYIACQPKRNTSIWFCSRIRDGRDFNFGAIDPTAKAYAGSNPEVGQPGDDIFALIPSWDDYLFFACRSSWWVMLGDPGRGGRCQVFNQSIGILGQRAYCFDHRGNLYFLSPAGLCRINRKTLIIEPLASNDLPAVLEEIDTAATLVQLAFEPITRTVHVFLTPTDGVTVGTHVVYDPNVEGRNSGGGQWLDTYPVNLQPWSVTQVGGAGDDDRRLFMGTNLGLVTRFDDAATSDDGTAIDAWVKYDPSAMGGGTAETMAMELQATLAPGSGAVSWYWHSANSRAEAAAQTLGVGYVATGSWPSGGRQQPVGLRSLGGAHMLVLRQNAIGVGFALEQAVAGLRAEARVRTGV